MAFVKSILFQKDRTWLVAMIMITALIGVTLTSLFSTPAPVVQAGAPNGFTSQTYQDTDGNGIVDRILVVINGSEDLTTCTVTDTEVGTDWTYVANDLTSTALASSGNTHSCVLSTETVILQLTGGSAGITGHSTAPTIAYTNGDADDSIRNTTDILGTVSAANIADGAGPMVKSLTIEDTGKDGKVDKITVTFSENVDTDNSVAPVLADLGTIVLPDGQTVSSATISDPAGSASTVVLTVITDQSTVNTAAGATAISGDISTKWVDAAFNTPHAVGGTGNESVTDSAKPAVITADFKTAALSGITYNVLELVYSEPLTVSNDGGGDADIAGSGTGASSANLGDLTTAKTLEGIASWNGADDMNTNAAADNTIGMSADSKTMTIYFNAEASSYWSTAGTAPTTPTVTPIADVSDITDVNNNAVNTGTVTASNSAGWDIAAPTVLTTYSCDTDADGDVDRIQATFSENMRDAEFTAGHWEGDNDSTNSGGGEETVNAYDTATGGCDGSADDTDANDDKVRFDLSTGITGTDLAFLHLNTAGARDHAGNRMVTDDAVGTETDKAKPILNTVVLSLASNRNRITFTYSENITVSNGASTTSVGDMTTAGTVAGFGSFATAGDATINTLKNTIAGSGSTAITLDFANEAGGAITVTSSPGTVLGGVVTPLANSGLVDGNSNQVNTGSSPTASGSGFDLTRPTLTSITLDDASNNNGRLDKATLVFSHAMRDTSFTSADATLGAQAGTFDNTGDDTTSIFTNTADVTLAVDTSATGADFLYSAATTSMTDLAGNLLDLATDGAIASGDSTETDGAAPIVVSADFKTATLSSVTYNALVIVYSEPMTVSNDGGGDADIAGSGTGASSANLGDLTTAKTLEGIGSWNGADDMVTNAAADNTIGMSADSKTLTVYFNAQASSYWATAGTAPTTPTFTPTADVNDITDAVNKAVNTATVTAANSTGWDIVVPTITTTYSCDADGDGDVERFQVNFSENMWDSGFTAGNFEGDNDDTNSGSGEETMNSFNTATGGCDGSADDTDANDDKVRFDLSTGITGTELAFVHHNTLGARDQAGNRLALINAAGTETDKAKPIVSSADFKTAVLSSVTYNALVLVYSEAMTVSNDGGGDADIAGSGTGASSANLGDLTTAKTLEGIASWNGADDMNTNAAADSTIGMSSDSKTLTVYFNSQAAGYWATSGTAPTTPTVTPIGDANDMTDAAGNAVNTSTVVAANTTGWDITKPTITSITIDDASGNNGQIDKATLVFSENMRDTSFTSVDGNLAAGGTTTGTFDNTGNDTTSIFTRGTDDATVGTAASDGDFTYSGSTTKMTDHAGNRVDTATDGVIVTADVTETDGAKPIVISITPASAATGASRTNNILIVFSETMENTAPLEGTEFSFSPDPGTFVGSVTTTTVTDDTYTINPGATLACVTTYTVTTTAANIDDASTANNVLNDAAAEDGDWSFTTTGCSSSGGGGGSGSTAKTYSSTITSPNGGEELISGATATITWSTGGTGITDYINLYYSTDGGDNYTLIEKNVLNNGSYTWSVPEGIHSSEAVIKMEGTDLAKVLSSDNSNTLFTINGVETSVPDAPVDAPTTAETGLSPVTGEPESISEINPGDYITGASFSTIYYIDGDMVRHPFMDAQTYFTWRTSFNSVLNVTDATLPTLTLGTPILPRPGVVLIKIQSDPKVYAVLANPDNAFKPTLRWITTEDVAKGLYGDSWADYIIDISNTLFGRFIFGTDVASINDLSVDIGTMKKRLDLN